MSLPMEFSFDGAAVRVVLVEGEPWWVAADVARSLEYRDAHNMCRSLDDDEKGAQIVRPHGGYSQCEYPLDEKGRQIVPTPGGDQEMLIINESGLYSAILRSRKASAKRFKKWVTAEVLPSIRKHGAYVMPAAQAEPAPAPMSSHVAADEMVSAGRVFRSLFGTARSMGMSRRLAATRANLAAQRATGIDLAAELGASQWLDGPDLPEPQRKQYELQQRLRAHLVANDWPQGFSSQQVIEALGLVNDRGTQTAVGHCLGLLGYRRTRLSTPGRPYAYVLSTLPATA